MEYLQKSHKRSKVVKLNLFRDVLGLDVFVLSSNEDQAAFISPSVFLHPVFQCDICKGRVKLGT